MSRHDLTGIVVYKMTGSGNDFLVVDGRHHPDAWWTAERVRVVCTRRMGPGADGLIVLEPGTGPGRVRFHFYNSDGSRGAMCGNGALCATRLAAWLELASPEHMILETDAGEVTTRCLTAENRAELTLPDITKFSRPSIKPESGEQAFGQFVVGVDHLVVLVDDLEAVDMDRRARALRSHPALGPAGANVNFVARDGAGWAMRTFERGVEGETLACGTGAVACGTFLAAQGLITLPWQVRTRSGVLLDVVADRQPTEGTAIVLERPRLGGEARLVYRASLLWAGPEASSLST